MEELIELVLHLWLLGNYFCLFFYILIRITVDREA